MLKKLFRKFKKPKEVTNYYSADHKEITERKGIKFIYKNIPMEKKVKKIISKNKSILESINTNDPLKQGFKANINKNNSIKIFRELAGPYATNRDKIPVYLFYGKSNLEYIYFPKLVVSYEPKIKIIKKAYRYNSLTQELWKVTDKYELEQLDILEIEVFYNACKKAFILLKQKIYESESRGVEYQLLIPSTGGSHLLKVFEKFFDFEIAKIKWKEVNFSDGSEGDVNKNMENAFFEEIKPVFGKTGKPKHIIILDAAVSGTSLSKIFKIFKNCLNKRINLQFDQEKQYFRSILEKHLGFFFTLKKKENRFDFSVHYKKAVEQLKATKINKQIKLKNIKLLESNTEKLIKLFNNELKTYLDKNKQNKNSTYNELHQNHYNNIIIAINNLFKIIKDKINNNENIKIEIGQLDTKIKNITQIENEDSMISIALGRKVYEEWMAVFGLKLFFIIVRDTKSLNDEEFSKESFYKSIFNRSFAKSFSCLGIPTEDIIPHEAKKKLLKNRNTEYYEVIRGQEEIAEIIEKLKDYRKKYDNTSKF